MGIVEDAVVEHAPRLPLTRRPVGSIFESICLPFCFPLVILIRNTPASLICFSLLTSVPLSIACLFCRRIFIRQTIVLLAKACAMSLFGGINLALDFIAVQVHRPIFLGGKSYLPRNLDKQLRPSLRLVEYNLFKPEF